MRKKKIFEVIKRIFFCQTTSFCFNYNNKCCRFKTFSVYLSRNFYEEYQIFHPFVCSLMMWLCISLSVFKKYICFIPTHFIYLSQLWINKNFFILIFYVHFRLKEQWVASSWLTSNFLQTYSFKLFRCISFGLSRKLILYAKWVN